MNKRALACLIVLLSLGSWCVGRSGLHGAAFSYHGTENGDGILTPMTPPQVGVVLKSGIRELNKNEVLTGCKQGTETVKVFDAEGQPSTVTQMTLTCGDRVFVITGLRFEEF